MQHLDGVYDMYAIFFVESLDKLLLLGSIGGFSRILIVVN